MNTHPTVDHRASWRVGTGHTTFSLPAEAVSQKLRGSWCQGARSSLLPVKARTPEVIVPSVVTFSWDTRRTELSPVTPLPCRKTDLLGEGCRRMASPATPKGRVAPPKDTTRWARSVDPTFVPLTL